MNHQDSSSEGSRRTTKRLAVLIDAENAQASVFEALLAEVARYGDAAVKRIYGDFTSASSGSWKKVLNKHAIRPMQQFAYTTGKNATDSALIIDAMDLLYTQRFDGFCIVSSDSDFTGLALRIQEQGLMVLGFGEEKTPEAFRNACHKFVFTEVLRPIPEITNLPPSANRAPVVTTSQATAIDRPAEQTGASSPQRNILKRELPLQFVLQALSQAEGEDGWAGLGAFGSYLTKLKPDFDSRLYGYGKLSELVVAKPHVFDVEERTAGRGAGKALYVRRATSKQSGKPAKPE
jgi:uncharacterized LabA/DUF88 family protein